MNKAIVLLLVTFATFRLHAQPQTQGNGLTLQTACGKVAAISTYPSTMLDGWCIGLVSGEAFVLDATNQINLPDGTTPVMEARAVMKYIEDHPEQLADSPRFLVMKALVTAYPRSKATSR